MSADDRLAGESAVPHLVALGHRRIGFISGPDRFVSVQRKLDGYRTAPAHPARRARRSSWTTWSR